MVVRGGSHFCQSPKSGGGQEFFNQNMREGRHFLLEKIPKFPSPPSPRKNVPSLKIIVASKYYSSFEPYVDTYYSLCSMCLSTH